MASYQRLFDLAERLDAIQAVKEGLASVDRDEEMPIKEAFKKLEKDLRRPQAAWCISATAPKGPEQPSPERRPGSRVLSGEGHPARQNT
jgi:hypothetical protein